MKALNLCHTIKPIDKDTIIEAAEKTGAIVTAEEHQLIASIKEVIKRKK